MIRILLLVLYILAILESTFELGIGIAPGLSAKNLLLYALVFAILARAALMNTKIYIPLPEIQAAFFALVAYATLSWTVNSLFDPTYPAFSAFKALKSEMVDNFLFFLVFFFGANTYKEAKSIFLFGVHMIALMSVLTIIDASPFLNLGFMEQDSDGRVRGPIGESNQYGAFMVFVVPLFAAMALGSTGVARVAWWAIFFCGFGLLVLTGSRGAYLGIVLGAAIGMKFVAPFFDRRRMLRASVAIGAVLAVIVLAVSVINLDLVTERVEQSTSTDVEELSSGRASIWRATVMVQAQEPFSFLVGKGWDAHKISGIWKSAHNTYLLMLFELGLIGVLLFAILMAVVIRQIRILVERTSGKERVLMSGLAFGLFGVLVAITFVELSVPWFYIWSFIGMSLRIAYEKNQAFQAGREEQTDSVAIGAASNRLADY